MIHFDYLLVKYLLTSNFVKSTKIQIYWLMCLQHIICRVNQYLTNILCKNMAIYGKVKRHLFKNVRSMGILCVWTMCGYKPKFSLVSLKAHQPRKVRVHWQVVLFFFFYFYFFVWNIGSSIPKEQRNKS
jgi:hypothetical protein